MQASDKQPTCGWWTSMEQYMLLAILRHELGGKEFTIDVINNVNVEKNSEKYRDVVQIVLHYDICISLASKSPSQLKAKLTQCIKVFKLLKLYGLVNILPLVIVVLQ